MLIIALTATFTAEPVEEPLNFWMNELDIPGLVKFAPYNQLFQQLLDPASALSTNQSGLNVVLIRLAHYVHPTDNWPLFEFRATMLGPQCTRLQIGFDELAAAAGDDRRASGETRAVLLAAAGGESLDPTPVRNDAASNLGTTGRNGLRRGECNKAAGRRKSLQRSIREMFWNGSSSRFQVSANQVDGPLRAG